MLVFVLGGAMAGVAALLFTIRFGITKFDIGFISASRRSPPRCSAASATCAARCSAVCCSASSRCTPPPSSSSNWADVTAFVVLVLVLMFRPTGLLGESLGKARA